ncbi:MAG: ATP-binding cassette domain-containing protein [Deltaproteobacteria bacterium]|nr:ATP-binding cassette domain-containing protein [Deltaproteobacteria bacterium]
MTGPLRCEGVSLLRGQRAVLSGIDATFPTGAVSLITGPTGVGKSTLLHLLGGLMRPTEGTVFAGDAPISRWTAGHRDEWRRRVGMALQAPHLLPGLTALENTLLPLVPRATSLADLRERAREVLGWLGAGHLADEPAGELSGGERQRVSLARSLVGAPDFLLWDEPTAHQDADGVALIADALRRERDRGAVVVAAAHDPRLSEGPLPDLLFPLEDGSLRCSTP